MDRQPGGLSRISHFSFQKNRHQCIFRVPSMSSNGHENHDFWSTLEHLLGDTGQSSTLAIWSRAPPGAGQLWRHQGAPVFPALLPCLLLSQSRAAAWGSPFPPGHSCTPDLAALKVPASGDPATCSLSTPHARQGLRAHLRPRGTWNACSCSALPCRSHTPGHSRPAPASPASLLLVTSSHSENTFHPP